MSHPTPIAPVHVHKAALSIEAPGVYDGTAFYQCECGLWWHRFKADDYRRAAAERYAALHMNLWQEIPHVE